MWLTCSNTCMYQMSCSLLGLIVVMQRLWIARQCWYWLSGCLKGDADSALHGMCTFLPLWLAYMGKAALCPSEGSSPQSIFCSKLHCHHGYDYG